MPAAAPGDRPESDWPLDCASEVVVVLEDVVADDVVVADVADEAAD